MHCGYTWLPPPSAVIDEAFEPSSESRSLLGRYDMIPGVATISSAAAAIHQRGTQCNSTFSRLLRHYRAYHGGSSQVNLHSLL